MPTQRPPAPPHPRASVVPEPSPGGTPDWDEVDEASWESFPASDPPSFTPENAVAYPRTVPESHDEPAPREVARARAARRARLFTLAGVTVALAAGALIWRRRRRAAPTLDLEAEPA